MGLHEKNRNFNFFSVVALINRNKRLVFEGKHFPKGIRIITKTGLHSEKRFASVYLML